MLLFERYFEPWIGCLFQLELFHAQVLFGEFALAVEQQIHVVFGSIFGRILVVLVRFVKILLLMFKVTNEWYDIGYEIERWRKYGRIVVFEHETVALKFPDLICILLNVLECWTLKYIHRHMLKTCFNGV